MAVSRASTCLVLSLLLGAMGRGQDAKEQPPALPPDLAALAEEFTSERPIPEALVAAVRSWGEPTEPAKIVGPIFYVGTRGLAAYLITTAQGHILLDGGLPGSARAFEAAIRGAGFRPEDIKILLITHAHIDHAGLVAHFQRLSNAQVVVMDRDAELLASGGRADFRYRDVPAFHFPGVTADRRIKDGDSVTLGSVKMTARLGAGHTRGATTWLTTVRDGDREYDVVFPCCLGINPGYRLVVDPSYPGIADDYARTVAMLESLKPDIWLPPHAVFFGFEARRARAVKDGVAAWVDPEGYGPWIAKQKANFEQLLAKEKLLGPSQAASTLAGTSWKLVRFRGGDDSTLAPDDPARYTLEFQEEGRLAARVDCNRGSGTWKSDEPNQLELGPLALTKMACPPSPFADRLLKDWSHVRSYVLKDGRLYVSLMADGGIYELEPLETSQH
jgi:metallo-beta-lactamase class B